MRFVVINEEIGDPPSADIAGDNLQISEEGDLISLEYTSDSSPVAFTATIDSDKKTLEKETAQEIATNETATGTQPQEIPITTKVATLKEIEMETIKLSVERNKWNMTTTAEELGISRMTLYRKLEKYGLRGKD